MKLIIDNAALARAVKTATRVMASRSTIPVLQCCRLGAGSGVLTAEATDMERFIAVEVEAEIETPGEILVDGARLAAVAAGLPAGGQARLTLGEQMLTVTSGSARWRLGRALDIAEWPRAAAVEGDRLDLDGKEFAALLGRVAYAMSNEVSRYYLCGAFLQRVTDTALGETALRAVATDGHRVVRADMPWPPKGEPGAFDAGFILPREAVAEIRALAEAAGTVTVAATPSLFAMEAGEVRLTSKLIDGIFPDYRRVIPSGEPEARIRLDAAAMTRAERRVERFASDSGKEIRSRAVCIARDGEALVLAASAGGEGDAVDRIEAEIEGKFDFVGINGIYLRDTLSALEADTAEIALTGDGSPIRFRSLTDDSQLHVIMPLRITKPAAIAAAEEET